MWFSLTFPWLFQSVQNSLTFRWLENAFPFFQVFQFFQSEWEPWEWVHPGWKWKLRMKGMFRFTSVPCWWDQPQKYTRDLKCHKNMQWNGNQLGQFQVGRRLNWYIDPQAKRTGQVVWLWPSTSCETRWRAILYRTKHTLVTHLRHKSNQCCVMWLRGRIVAPLGHLVCNCSSHFKKSLSLRHMFKLALDSKF